MISHRDQIVIYTRLFAASETRALRSKASRLGKYRLVWSIYQSPKSFTVKESGPL